MRSYHFACLAKEAYLDPDVADFTKYGYEFTEFCDVDGAQAYVLCDEDEGRIVVVFRGTQATEWNDIKADIYATHTNGFHSGFLKEYLKLHKEVIRAVARFQVKMAPDWPVVLCGHSLGGAMAQVASYYVPWVDEIYTYGSPRAISWFKDKLCVPHYRHVHNNDIVPSVPFLLMVFRHCGQLQYIDYDGDLVKATFWQRFKDSWKGRRDSWKQGKWFDGISDHSMDLYCKFLEDE